MPEAGGLGADDILSIGFARDDGLVGDGFVGISCEFRELRTSKVQPRPAVVGLSFDFEPQSQVAVLHALAPVLPGSVVVQLSIRLDSDNRAHGHVTVVRAEVCHGPDLFARAKSSGLPFTCNPN